MFGARSDEGWRLCHRKGRTIYFVNEEHFPDFPVEFPTQRAAKMCADDLNELWKPYWSKESKGEPVDRDLWEQMLNTIVHHNGLSADDLREIKKNAP